MELAVLVAYLVLLMGGMAYMFAQLESRIARLEARLESDRLVRQALYIGEDEAPF